jgi:UDP-N-acetylmuramate--alanine ligase
MIASWQYNEYNATHMHVYFSGIGGTAIGPLALIAKQAGLEVSGSDKQNSSYIDYLKTRGITAISIEQTKQAIEKVHEKQPIQWLVYSSAVPKENPNHPELIFAKENNIKTSKRDEFLNKLLSVYNKKMIAVAGTHGKTTTTAMLIWLFKQLELPVSYSVGAKLSFGDMGEFNKDSRYFIYEADEYDKNFLSYYPVMSVLSGIDYDHPDIYPTRQDYYQAFKQFVDQSQRTVSWQADAKKIDILPSVSNTVLDDNTDLGVFTLVGKVNRMDAHASVVALEKLGLGNYKELVEIINKFPGISRRFEMISNNIYSDYAHTPEKIRGALQTALETNENVVIVYEGLHNTRQHFIKEELGTVFEGAKKLYVVPSYLARENETLEILTPEKLCEIVKSPVQRIPEKLDDNLKMNITEHVNSGDLVLCLSAGGGGSLDEWLKSTFGASVVSS